MQIYSSTQNNKSNHLQNNFKAIKSVKCEGLFKKFPEYGQILVDTFQQNPKAMEFCKKYDVDIVFYALKKAISDVESSIHIIFENPAKKKFLGFLGNTRDKISISGYHRSLEESVDTLKNYIENNQAGVLNANIENKENEILKAIEEIMIKKAEKHKKEVAKVNNLTQKEENSKKLQNSIRDLINNSK